MSISVYYFENSTFRRYAGSDLLGKYQNNVPSSAHSLIPSWVKGVEVSTKANYTSWDLLFHYGILLKPSNPLPNRNTLARPAVLWPRVLTSSEHGFYCLIGTPLLPTKPTTFYGANKLPSRTCSRYGSCYSVRQLQCLY